jgi:predicted transcriptional regulator of viral defense system
MRRAGSSSGPNSGPNGGPNGRIEAWVNGLQARGRYTFRRSEAAKVLGRGDVALTKVLGRLVRKRRIVSPRRGFYVIVPAEFSLRGTPPADWFIDDLMRFVGHRYYVGLLTAAALHGAAHQQPQQFQVVVDAPLRPVRVGNLNVVFMKKEGVERCPVQRVNTSTGTMAISTPEVTAFDLVKYAAKAGQLSNVATVLAELAEKIDPEQLVSVAEDTGVEMSVVQRLGYLLDEVEMSESATSLASWVAMRSPRWVQLRPGRSATEAPTADRWRVRVNADVEPDL